MVQSSLIYAVVAVGTNVLAEYATCSGNFNQVTKAILERIPAARNSKMTYVYEDFLFHYVCEDGVVYLVMADSAFGRRIPFNFLMEIKTKFREQHSIESIRTARAFGMNDFSRTLNKQMNFYNSNPQADKIQKVQAEVDSVKEVVAGNIEKVLERGERFENLMDKTETLKQSTFLFKRNAEDLYEKVLAKNIFFWVLLTMATFAVMYIGIGIGCGFPKWQKCFIQVNPSPKASPSNSPKAAAAASPSGGGAAASPSGAGAAASPSGAAAASASPSGAAAASASPSGAAAASASASPAAAASASPSGAAAASATPTRAAAFLMDLVARVAPPPGDYGALSPSPSPPKVNYFFFAESINGTAFVPAPIVYAV